jgi:hypothetical protein
MDKAHFVQQSCLGGKPGTDCFKMDPGRHMKFKITVVVSLILLAIVFYGCFRRPADLARRIADADCVIASDWNHGSRKTIKAQEAERIIQAVSSAKRLSPWSKAAAVPLCTIEFYRGTNLLAFILVLEEWFADGDVECIDKTGLLKALQRDLKVNDQGRKDWVNHLADLVVTSPDLGRIKPWSIEVLERYSNGQLRLVRDSKVELDYREIPDWLAAAFRSAGLRSPQVYVHLGATGKPEGVMLDWYKYGLLVGTTNSTATVEAWYLTNAAPGISVYSGAK